MNRPHRVRLVRSARRVRISHREARDRELARFLVIGLVCARIPEERVAHERAAYLLRITDPRRSP